MTKRFALLILLLSMTLAGCTRPEHATKVLEDQGYTHIEITGYRFWACDEKDTFSTGFRAVSPAGKSVSGVVCEGFLKNATIRFD